MHLKNSIKTLDHFYFYGRINCLLEFLFLDFYDLIRLIGYSSLVIDLYKILLKLILEFTNTDVYFV